MRGLDELRPRGPMVPGDLVTWEAVYGDGTTLRERDGGLYRAIDRPRLSCFKLVSPGEVLLEAFPPIGASGLNLIYRRRTMQHPGGPRRVVFLVAYAPMGPAVMVDPGRGTYRTEGAFIEGDPEMYPPVLERAEGEGFLLDVLTSVT